MDTKTRLKHALELTRQAERAALDLPHCKQVPRTIATAKHNLDVRIQDVWPDQRRSLIQQAVTELIVAAERSRELVKRNSRYDDVEALCNRAVHFLVIW